MDAHKGMAGKRSEYHVVAEKEFGRWVVSDLKRAKCKKEQLTSVVLGTVSTTIAFLRGKRRDVLAGNLTARQLAKEEFDFENALLRSVRQALPHSHKRGRKKVPRAEEKFLRIVRLRKQGKSWEQIAQSLAREFGFASAAGYQKCYFRHLPIYLSWYRNRFRPDVSEQDFLAWARPLAKRRPGRPKSGQKSNR